MKLEDAVNYFGSAYKMCSALGIKIQNYTIWRKKNQIPYVSQMRLQEYTEGFLKADDFKDCPRQKVKKIDSLKG